MSYEDGRTSNAVARLGVLFVYGVANVVFSVLSGSCTPTVFILV
jgi:hypothetical protein